MSVNPHDDYEKLAKLLYPSIEASGNVYYGQTRKLTLDAIFDKYNLGFDSHFKSITDTENNKTFTWRLGPLTDTVRCDVATYKGNDHPLFLKYELSYIDQQVDNTISSGIYHSYEKTISITFKDSIITYCCSPIQNDDGTYDSYDGRNFYLDLKNNFLYVHMGGCDFASEPLTITRNDPSDNSAKVILAGSNITFNALDAPVLFQYNKNNAGWFDYDINSIINLTKNDFVQFRCIAPYTPIPSTYVYFEITDANVDLSGNIQSMSYNGIVKNYAYINMFRHCDAIINADKLIIPNIAPYACKWMFYQCSNLKSAPILPSQTLAESCYASMFSGCTALEDAPILVAKNGAEDCYETLFCDCASLTYIESHLNKDDYTTNGQTNKSTHYWVGGNISSEGLFMSPYADDLPYDACNIPSNWEKGNDGLTDLVSSVAVGIYSVGIQSRDHFYTCGSNSSENGRGDITNNSTLSNMEKSFDENKTHKMNTYNADGSFNQEVWGYKSFNSPVQFRNGLYLNNSRATSNYDYYVRLGSGAMPSTRWQAYSEEVVANKSVDNTAKLSVASFDKSTRSPVNINADWSQAAYIGDMSYMSAGTFNPTDVFKNPEYNYAVAYTGNIDNEYLASFGVHTNGNYDSDDTNLVIHEAYVDNAFTRIASDSTIQLVSDISYNTTYNNSTLDGKLIKSAHISLDHGLSDNHNYTNTNSGSGVVFKDESNLDILLNNTYDYLYSTTSGQSISSNTLAGINSHNDTYTLYSANGTSEIPLAIGNITKLYSSSENTGGITNSSKAYITATTDSALIFPLCASDVKLAAESLNENTAAYIDAMYSLLGDTTVDICAKIRDVSDNVITDYISQIKVNAKNGITTHGNILPDKPDQFDIGANDTRYNNVYANNFYGEIPYIGGFTRSVNAVEDGTINYSTLHIYSGNTNQEDLYIPAGTIVTIKNNNDLYIDGVQQYNVLGYLFSTQIENDPSTGNVKLTSGDAFGAIYNISEVSFTPLCDVTLKFDNTYFSVANPDLPDINDSLIKDIEFSKVLEQTAYEIAREMTIDRAREVGASHRIRDLLGTDFANGLRSSAQDYINSWKVNENILPSNITYTDPANDYISHGVMNQFVNVRQKLAYNKLRKSIDDGNIVDSNIVSAINKVRDDNINTLTENEKTAVGDYMLNVEQENLAKDLTSTLKQFGFTNASILKSELNISR